MIIVEIEPFEGEALGVTIGKLVFELYGDEMGDFEHMLAGWLKEDWDECDQEDEEGCPQHEDCNLCEFVRKFDSGATLAFDDACVNTLRVKDLFDNKTIATGIEWVSNEAKRLYGWAKAKPRHVKCIRRSELKSGKKPVACQAI